MRLSASRHLDVVLHWQHWDLPTPELAGFGEHLARYARTALRR